jgi:malate dehydrogenase (oxaloacetate-decarboxylating)
LNPLFEIRHDSSTGEAYLETSLLGPLLLEHPLLNKGSAFTDAERRELGLLGLLPPEVSTPERQLERIYGNYLAKTSDMERYLYLVALQDRNETAFYRLVSEHLAEMMPIIYTPVVGEACQTYSRIYNRPRGIFISYPQRADIDAILDNVAGTRVEVIVVTDGERILGLGDLGVGGMGIPIGKLALYSACAGIHPSATLPIVLDAGTNNPALLNDPLYLGWRHERVRGREYDEFVEAFVRAVERRFPHAILQWEDFAKGNAGRLLERYRDRICSFNDDIQGTGSVTLAVAMAAATATGAKLSDQRVVLFGAGSAATGIATQLVAAMRGEGLSEVQARARLWLVDSVGLVHSRRSDIEPFKQQYAQPHERIAGWKAAAASEHSLLEVIEQAHPTMLIGTAAQANAFDERVIRAMAQHTARPIVFPLSNPTSKAEAKPADVIAWSDGRALVATGSPFAPVAYGDGKFDIAQCNNAYIFPGVGLGVLASQARRIPDEIFVAAARALSELAPSRNDPTAPLLPPLSQIRSISRHVALAVGRAAQRLGVADATGEEELAKRVDAKMWEPRYLPYRRRKS